MPTLFTKIIRGELPGRFVWRDDRAVAFLTIEPLTSGHTLVVPIEEVDHWLDASDELSQHLLAVSRKIGEGIQQAFGSERIGLVIGGFEVPHLHLHLFPANAMSDFDFRGVNRSPRPEDLDRDAEAIRRALRHLGHSS